MLNPEASRSTPRVVTSEQLSVHGAVVIVDGELDMVTSRQLESELGDRIAEGHRQLVVDLTAATFFDSTAIRTLVTAIAPLRDDADAVVVLAGVHGVVERALTVSGLGSMFTDFTTRADAIDGLAATAQPLHEGWREMGRRPVA